MILLWYPKCSTCRRVKEHLENKNIKFSLRDIVLDNPTKEELLKWCNEENIKEFFNTSGILYRELDLKNKLSKMTYLEKIDLLKTNGKLVKRPILLTEKEVLVGPKKIESKF